MQTVTPIGANVPLRRRRVALQRGRRQHRRENEDCGNRGRSPGRLPDVLRDREPTAERDFYLERLLHGRLRDQGESSVKRVRTAHVRKRKPGSEFSRRTNTSRASFFPLPQRLFQL